MNTFQSLLLDGNSLGLSWLLYLSLSKPKEKNGKLVLDSCTLIDGRILEMSKSGALYRDLIIPDFVLRELQLLADGKNAHKRARARFGLEVAESLRQTMPTKVTIDTSIDDIGKTDDLLVKLAKKRGAILCTTDYGLSKVAAIVGVDVLNLHELSLAMRTNVLPGEEKEVKIIQAGDTPSQGVGYLEDGVMVVVYGAGKKLGTKQVVVIERSLQTVAGKMCFAHLKSDDASPKRTKHKG